MRRRVPTHRHKIRCVLVMVMLLLQAHLLRHLLRKLRHGRVPWEVLGRLLGQVLGNLLLLVHDRGWRRLEQRLERLPLLLLLRHVPLAKRVVRHGRHSGVQGDTACARRFAPAAPPIRPTNPLHGGALRGCAVLPRGAEGPRAVGLQPVGFLRRVPGGGAPDRGAGALRLRRGQWAQLLGEVDGGCLRGATAE